MTEYLNSVVSLCLEIVFKYLIPQNEDCLSEDSHKRIKRLTDNNNLTKTIVIDASETLLQQVAGALIAESFLSEFKEEKVTVT